MPITIKIGTDIQVGIEITQITLPISKNDNLDNLIEKIGFPDAKKSISVQWPETKYEDGFYYDTAYHVNGIYVTHYFYKKYPYLCISYNYGFDCTEFSWWETEIAELTK